MTRKEALVILRERVALGEREYMREIPDYVEALKTAVSALEADPCGDCISRQAVLDRYRVTDPGGTFTYCSSILDFVESLPAVVPMPDPPDRQRRRADEPV